VIWATDYSSTAVDVVKANPLYPKPPNGKGILHAAVWDITARPPTDSPVTYSLPEGLEPGTVDVITVIYVLSALHPTEWDQAIHNLYAVRASPFFQSRC
jgi:tRNAThr (cytosine32-N3)-methyltransferase